jgi:copper(I)-binding protein
MSMQSSRRSLRKALAVIGAIVLAAGLAGCGTASTPTPSAATLTIEGAWVRPPLGADRPAAGYLSITNPGGVADALIGVTSPIAMSCEIHETSMDSSGMTGMHPIDRLEIPAGGAVKLEPGGYHLMLMETEILTVGSTVELRLEFEKAGTVVVQAEVREG